MVLCLSIVKLGLLSLVLLFGMRYVAEAQLLRSAKHGHPSTVIVLLPSVGATRSGIVRRSSS